MTPAVAVAFLVFSMLWLFRQAIFSATGQRRYAVLDPLVERRVAMDQERATPSVRVVSGRGRAMALRCGLATVSVFLGFELAGPVAGFAAGAAGAWLPFALDRRRRARGRALLEQQFAEYAEAMAMAVRGGLSIRNAMEFAAEEAEEPLANLLHRIFTDHRLGSSLERVLDHLTGALPTNETRLLTLVLRLHARSGGNLAASLEEVAAAVRGRVAARRDLLALSAQGRMSGAILASLPVGFFLVLAASSPSDMSHVLRSPAGMALVASGLLLQGLGYVWIRHLLRLRV